MFFFVILLFFSPSTNEEKLFEKKSEENIIEQDQLPLESPSMKDNEIEWQRNEVDDDDDGSDEEQHQQRNENVDEITSSPASSSQTAVINADEATCVVCGCLLSAQNNRKHDGCFGGKKAKHPSLGINTGISSKANIVNWLATRMTVDQMLLVASCDDNEDISRATPSNQLLSLANSNSQSTMVPSGWLPNEVCFD